MEIVLRQIGYTLDEINKMSDRQILYRFLIGQKFLTGDGDKPPQQVDGPPQPPSSPPKRGVRQRPSGTSYNFPR